MRYRLKFYTGPIRDDAADEVLVALRRLGRGGSFVGTEHAYFEVEADNRDQALRFGQDDLVILFGPKTGFRVQPQAVSG
jgi:hypothetical protein